MERGVVSGSQVVTGGQTYTTGQTTYVTNAQQSYTTVQPSEKLYSANTVYTTGPSRTTYEYVNAPASNTYVEQRWEANAPYGVETGTYEYTNYP